VHLSLPCVRLVLMLASRSPPLCVRRSYKSASSCLATKLSLPHSLLRTLHPLPYSPYAKITAKPSHSPSLHSLLPALPQHPPLPRIPLLYTPLPFFPFAFFLSFPLLFAFLLSLFPPPIAEWALEAPPRSPQPAVQLQLQVGRGARMCTCPRGRAGIGLGDRGDDFRARGEGGQGGGGGGDEGRGAGVGARGHPIERVGEAVARVEGAQGQDLVPRHVLLRPGGGGE
jgi:hypothetical protein